MPLQNRVWPDGSIQSHPLRGLFLGNRGGVIHKSDTKTLHPTKRWASRQWICCILDFKGRKRELMSSNSYTELFFCDEVTALAAGHRPCFECRRADALAFSRAWQIGAKLVAELRAPAMDKILHEERLHEKEKRFVPIKFEEMANGAMAELEGHFIAKCQNEAWLWSPEGYTRSERPSGELNLLTSKSINDYVLKSGYKPVWHPSIKQSL